MEDLDMQEPILTRCGRGGEEEAMRGGLMKGAVRSNTEIGDGLRTVALMTIRCALV